MLSLFQWIGSLSFEKNNIYQVKFVKTSIKLKIEISTGMIENQNSASKRLIRVLPL